MIRLGWRPKIVSYVRECFQKWAKRRIISLSDSERSRKSFLSHLMLKLFNFQEGKKPSAIIHILAIRQKHFLVISGPWRQRLPQRLTRHKQSHNVDRAPLSWGWHNCNNRTIKIIIVSRVGRRGLMSGLALYRSREVYQAPRWHSINGTLE